MEKISTYCDYCATLPADNVHKLYHDTEYGFPVFDDNVLFERLILEINQAGLSWNIILNKRQSFKAAYSNFDIKTVANYQEKDRERLLSDPGVIRNKLKVHAAIHNAQVILQLQKEYGSFKNWLDIHAGNAKLEWVALFKKNFKFTGGEIVNEFLMSTGYLPGAHIPSCPVYAMQNRS